MLPLERAGQAEQAKQAQLRERIDECLQPLWDYVDLHHGVFAFGSDGTLLGFTPLRTIFQATHQRVRLTQIRREVVALANEVFETVRQVKGDEWPEQLYLRYAVGSDDRRDLAVIFPLHGGAVLIALSADGSKLSMTTFQFGQLLGQAASRLSELLREG